MKKLKAMRAKCFHMPTNQKNYVQTLADGETWRELGKVYSTHTVETKPSLLRHCRMNTE